MGAMMTRTVHMKAFCADAVVSQKNRVCGLPVTQGSVLDGRGCDARSGSEVEGWPRCDGGAACDHLRVPCTVLIVDDHDGFRSLAKALLEAEGFEVVGEAGDAVGALAAAELLRPGVVLLDIQLPGIDGFEVAARLAATADPPQVVLVSTRDVSSYRRRLATSPVRGFIPKNELSGSALSALVS